MKKNKKNIALKQYQKSIDQSRFKVLAQKLAQHLNNLAEDKNTKIRWIWELIQNAKDAPNEFGKVKIKIEIYDDKFIFTHNGDPFRVSDLETLVAQYSSKAEQNKTHTETTGKYGTGFITTYILSRKVRIKGLLKINPKQQCIQAPKNDEKIQEDPDRFVPDEKMLNQQDDEKDYLYQRFQTLLDRTYKDRDKQLVQKLIKTQEHLKDDLQKNQPKPKWQRNQNDYNTQFIYQEIDAPGMEMLLPSMNCLKELFPYALLFNPMLSQLHLINKSDNKKIKNFSIQRIDDTEYSGLKVFNAKVSQFKMKPYTFSAAYIQDEDTYSMIAAPVSIDNGRVKLLQTNNKYPKIFKEFPLIGCQDHGFNFIFTSRKFYPNESRSDLLLNQIDDRPSKKAKQNWNSITGIFGKGLQLYKKLSEIISEGQQNLLIVSTSNQFTQTQFKAIGVSKVLLEYQSMIRKLDFIEFRNGKRGTLNDLILLQGKSQQRNITIQDYSALLNQTFAQIIGADRTLSNKNYKRFYQKLMQYSKTWKTSDKPQLYMNIDKCVNKISELGYKKIEQIYGKQQALNFLEGVILFLQKYHPKAFQGTYQIYQKLLLTNAYCLTNCHPGIYKKELLPQAYEQLGKHLDININPYTVHQRFAKYFQLQKFQIRNMTLQYRLKLIKDYNSPVQKIQPAKQITTLGRFLTTIGIKTECMELISELKGFQAVYKSYEISNKKTNLVIPPEDIKEYKNLFDLKVLRYISDILDQTQTLKKLQALTVFRDRSQTILWLNELFKQERAMLKDAKMKQIENLLQKCFNSFQFHRKKLISKNLSVSEHFIDRDQLRYFCDEDTKQKGFEPDEEDIIFLEKIRSKSRRSDGWSLRSSVIHKQIEDTTINPITFGEQYRFVVDLYNNTTTQPQIKLMILQEVYRLRRKAKQDKSQSFKLKVLKQIEKRAYIDYPNLVKANNNQQHLASQSEHNYAFHFIKNKQQINAAIRLSEEYGSLSNAHERIKLLQMKLKKFEKK